MSDTWLDVDEILPGEKWRIAIGKGLSNSDFIIVCLSEKSVTKRGFVPRSKIDYLMASSLNSCLTQDLVQIEAMVHDELITNGRILQRS